MLDTLYVLGDSRAAAEELVTKLPMERFGRLARVEDDPRIVRRAFGGAFPGPVIVAVVNTAYARGQYRRKLHYDAAPPGPLTPAEAAWATSLARNLK